MNKKTCPSLAVACAVLAVTNGAFSALSISLHTCTVLLTNLHCSSMIGSQKYHVLIRRCGDPLQRKSPQIPASGFSDPVCSHSTQPRCVLHSFLSHPFYIKLYPANHDGIPPQQLSPSRLLSSFFSPGPSTAPAQTHRSRRPPSAYKLISMAAYSAPYKATESEGVLLPCDTSRLAASLSRKNVLISPRIPHHSPHLFPPSPLCT